MEPHYRRFRWAGVLFVTLVAAAVGFFAYSAGVAHGLASAGQLAAPGSAPFPPYGWYRPWGFGFGFLFAPFFFFLLFAFAMRGLFWAGRRRQACFGGGYYGAGPQAFDEWHRRAHDRMTKDAGAAPDDNRTRG